MIRQFIHYLSWICAGGGMVAGALLYMEGDPSWRALVFAVLGWLLAALETRDWYLR